MAARAQRVVVLCSRRAPGIESLLRHSGRGTMFDLVAVITTEESFPQTEEIERYDVPVLHHSIRQFCAANHLSRNDRAGRRAFDRATTEILRLLEVDTVLLLGYLYILTEPMLETFSSSILNIHDSDLSLERYDSRRRYIGLHSTRDAILGGERSTRSTVHVVTEEVDGGPIVLLSDEYHVPREAADAVRHGDWAAVKRYAWLQRQSMMNDWGSLAAQALETMVWRRAPLEEATA